MSDKDWFESMPSPFVKPAATKCPNPNCVGGRIRQTNGGCCICEQPFTPVSQAQLDAERVPTPPASPTVTVQRWSFVTDDRTGSPVAFPNPNGQWVKYDDALTLLRAAERQK